MKTYSLLFVACLLILSVMSIRCTKERDLQPFAPEPFDMDTLVFEPSMKGWELYSWPSGKSWIYVILPGTNRLKTCEEVINHELAVLGKDSLKRLLEKLPEGEDIFWMSEGWLAGTWNEGCGKLSLPDYLTVLELISYCEAHELTLVISE